MRNYNDNTTRVRNTAVQRSQLKSKMIITLLQKEKIKKYNLLIIQEL